MKLTGRRALVAAAAAGVIVVAGTAVALAGGVPSGSGQNTASLPAGGRSAATLEVTTGTRLLEVKVAKLGGAHGTLLRASAPPGAQPPELTMTAGHVVLSASHGASSLTVTLNEAVRWRLGFAGGTERTVADLRGGKVSAVSFTAGSDIIDLTLPRPGAMVPVRLGGGASQFLVLVPGGVPVRVAAAGGAGEVSVDGSGNTGVGGGSVFATGGWSAGAAGFDVVATAGAALLSVARWQG